MSITDALISDAFQEMDKIDDAAGRELALVTILRVLIHGEPELVRSHLMTITSAWRRYELGTELFGALGLQEDLDRLQAVIPDGEFPEGEDVRSQLARLRIRVASGWRAKPMSFLMTGDDCKRRLLRSDQRLEFFRSRGGNAIMIFGELCLRISLGDTHVVAEAQTLAEGDADMRDRVFLAIGKAHSQAGRPMTARNWLDRTTVPINRIELMTIIASVEAETGRRQEQHVLP